MTKKKAGTTAPEKTQLTRLVPTQKRSRERYELILATAAELIAEQGSDALKMSDIVEKSGVPFGSLYQYFPDKLTIIGTLAERFHLEGRACVEAELVDVKNQKDLHAALLRIVDAYYFIFQQEPLLRHIWYATQGDRALQQLDADDMNALSAILAKVMRTLKPDSDSKDIEIIAALIMQMIATAVRYAIRIDPDEGTKSLEMFKRFLPKNVSSLLAP